MKVNSIKLTCDHVRVAVLVPVVRQVGRFRRKVLLRAERLHHLELVGEPEVSLSVHAGHSLDVEVGGDGGARLPSTTVAVASPSRGHGRLGVPVGHDAARRRRRGRGLVEVVVRLVEVFPVEWRSMLVARKYRLRFVIFFLMIVKDERDGRE